MQFSRFAHKLFYGINAIARPDFPVDEIPDLGLLVAPEGMSITQMLVGLEADTAHILAQWRPKAQEVTPIPEPVVKKTPVRPTPTDVAWTATLEPMAPVAAQRIGAKDGDEDTIPSPDAHALNQVTLIHYAVAATFRERGGASDPENLPAYMAFIGHAARTCATVYLKEHKVAREEFVGFLPTEDEETDIDELSKALADEMDLGLLDRGARKLIERLQDGVAGTVFRDFRDVAQATLARIVRLGGSESRKDRMRGYVLLWDTVSGLVRLLGEDDARRVLNQQRHKSFALNLLEDLDRLYLPARTFRAAAESAEMRADLFETDDIDRSWLRTLRSLGAPDLLRVDDLDRIYADWVHVWGRAQTMDQPTASQFWAKLNRATNPVAAHLAFDKEEEEDEEEGEKEIGGLMDVARGLVDAFAMGRAMGAALGVPTIDVSGMLSSLWHLAFGGAKSSFRWVWSKFFNPSAVGAHRWNALLCPFPFRIRSIKDFGINLILNIVMPLAIEAIYVVLPFGGVAIGTFSPWLVATYVIFSASVGVVRFFSNRASPLTGRSMIALRILQMLTDVYVAQDVVDRGELPVGPLPEGVQRPYDATLWFITKVWDNPWVSWGLMGVLTLGQMYFLVEEDPVKKELREQKREQERLKREQEEQQKQLVEQRRLQNEFAARVQEDLERMKYQMARKHDTVVGTADVLYRGGDVVGHRVDIAVDLEGYDEMYSRRAPIASAQRRAINDGLAEQASQSFDRMIPRDADESIVSYDIDAPYLALAADERQEAGELEQLRIQEWVAQKRRKRRKGIDAQMIGTDITDRGRVRLVQKFLALIKFAAMASAPATAQKLALQQALCAAEKLAGRLVENPDGPVLLDAPMSDEDVEKLRRLALEVRREEGREEEGEASFVGEERGGILRRVGRVALSVGSVARRVWSGLSTASEDYAAALRGEDIDAQLVGNPHHRSIRRRCQRWCRRNRRWWQRPYCEWNCRRRAYGVRGRGRGWRVRGRGRGGRGRGWGRGYI